MVRCELGGGQEVLGGGGGGGAIDMIRFVVVYQLKTLDLQRNDIVSHTPIRRTRHCTTFFCCSALAESDKKTVAAKKIREEISLHQRLMIEQSNDQSNKQT